MLTYTISCLSYFHVHLLNYFSSFLLISTTELLVDLAIIFKKIKNYFSFSKNAMNLKFDVRFKYSSRFLMFQLTCYVEVSSNNQHIRLKPEGPFIFQRFVLKFVSYIILIQQ